MKRLVVKKYCSFLFTGLVECNVLFMAGCSSVQDTVCPTLGEHTSRYLPSVYKVLFVGLYISRTDEEGFHPNLGK